MKYLVLFITLIFPICAGAQSLQLHYDLRHTVDPSRNSKNFPTLYFEYFKTPDSGKSFIKFGSFLFKSEADLTGTNDNIGKYYMQVSQDFRFWQPKIFLSLQYSGGLGVTNPAQYSYYIANTYDAGISYPFRWGSAYMSSVLDFKYVAYNKPSRDFLYTLYFYKGLWNYKAEFQGDFSLWTENRDHGDAATEGMTGKRFFFFAEPQFWYNISKKFSAGTKLNLYYHVNISDDVLQAYPTIGLRLKL